MNSIRKYLLAAAVLTAALSASAQAGDEQQIFRAMQDELSRSVDMALPGEQKPCYIAYYYGKVKRMDIDASLGALLSSSEPGERAIAGTRVLMGTYAKNSDLFDGMGVPMFPMPAQTDYYSIRRGFWQGTDAGYKQALLFLETKKQRSETESLRDAVLPDMSPVAPVTHLMAEDTTFVFDKAYWDGAVRELSAVFKEYPELFNTGTHLTAQRLILYVLTSEKVQLKVPQYSVSLSARASIRAADGSVVTDHFALSAANPKELPPVAEIRKQLERFAGRMEMFKTAGRMEQFYSGPVLFEGGAASGVFSRITNDLLIPRRVPLRSEKLGSTYLGRFNTRVLDERITITCHTNLRKYKDTELVGVYEVDMEGVAPAGQMVLVDKGFLRNMPNDRVPKRNIPASTGAARLVASVGSGYGGSIGTKIGYGTVHIAVKNGLSPEKMKKKLIREAKSQGLPCAYIIRSMGKGNPLVFRVNPADGKETLVLGAIPGAVDYLRMNVLDFSDKEVIANAVSEYNSPASVICPSAILFGKLDIRAADPVEKQQPALVNPNQRAGK